MSATHQIPTQLQGAEFPAGFGSLFCLKKTINYQSGQASMGFIPINGTVLWIATKTLVAFDGDARIVVGTNATANELATWPKIDDDNLDAISILFPNLKYTSKTELFTTVTQTSSTVGSMLVVAIYTP